MPDNEVRYIPQFLHPDRKLVVPMDQFIGGDFTTGILISGAVVSNALVALSGGGIIYSVTTSSVVKVRPLNIEMFNQEAGWVSIEFRDGSWNGGRVLGPYMLNPGSVTPIQGSQVIGRYFTSGIFGVVLSGWAAQPLSNGVKINISYVKEPLDWQQ